VTYYGTAPKPSAFYADLSWRHGSDFVSASTPLVVETPSYQKAPYIPALQGGDIRRICEQKPISCALGCCLWDGFYTALESYKAPLRVDAQVSMLRGYRNRWQTLRTR
jgi:hypothetical protein